MTGLLARSDCLRQRRADRVLGPVDPARAGDGAAVAPAAHRRAGRGAHLPACSATPGWRCCWTVAGYTAAFAAAAADPVRRFTDIEDERHSTNHAAIGCLLARNWGLSSDVCWAILHHHDYGVIDDAATDDAVRSLVALSLLAERALQAYQGRRASLEWNKGGARACAYLGVSADEADDLVDQLLDSFTH
jgi:hypothetical protein